ncbi:unnamed protein product [Linum trigynum]|uniref:Uncharacterized protein n=1 Tax=Linum trigynum TaxID=586398 RepID=A0AAV2FQL4_9ROSI
MRSTLIEVLTAPASDGLRSVASGPPLDRRLIQRSPSPLPRKHRPHLSGAVFSLAWRKTHLQGAVYT